MFPSNKYFTWEKAYIHFSGSKAHEGTEWKQMKVGETCIWPSVSLYFYINVPSSDYLYLFVYNHDASGLEYLPPWTNIPEYYGVFTSFLTNHIHPKKPMLITYLSIWMHPFIFSWPCCIKETVNLRNSTPFYLDCTIHSERMLRCY